MASGTGSLRKRPSRPSREMPSTKDIVNWRGPWPAFLCQSGSHGFTQFASWWDHTCRITRTATDRSPSYFRSSGWRTLNVCSVQRFCRTSRKTGSGNTSTLASRKAFAAERSTWRLVSCSRAVGKPWSVLWPRVRKLEEAKDVGKALAPQEEKRLLKSLSRMRSPIIGFSVNEALLTGLRPGELQVASGRFRWACAHGGEIEDSVRKWPPHSHEQRAVLAAYGACLHGSSRSLERFDRNGACFLTENQDRTTPRGPRRRSRPLGTRCAKPRE